MRRPCSDFVVISEFREVKEIRELREFREFREVREFREIRNNFLSEWCSAKETVQAVEPISCQSGANLPPIKRKSGWDILSVFPIRAID